MKHQLQFLGLVLSALSLAGGVIDLFIQYSNGDEASWRVPIVLIGIGLGLPAFILPFFDWSAFNTAARDIDNEDYSQWNLGGGFLSPSQDGESNYGGEESADRSDGD